MSISGLETQTAPSSRGQRPMGTERDKPFKWRLKSDSMETSLFRKLRTVKSELETFQFMSDLDDGRLERGIRLWNGQRCLHIRRPKHFV